MDRLFVVLGFMVLAGGIAGAAIWWIQGNQDLWKKRDFRGLMRRRAQLRRSLMLVIAAVLLAVAFFGAAYVYAAGGVLAL